VWRARKYVYTRTWAGEGDPTGNLKHKEYYFTGNDMLLQVYSVMF